MRQTRIQWHPAFYAAMQMEFRANKKDLEFQPEVNLTKKPLQLDLLIIKKLNQTELENRIGAVFRKYNIIEYKAPADSLNIDTFYKVNAYACLYKVSERKVNTYKASEITISFVRDGYPRNLIQTLRQEGYVVECRYPGIYYVTGSTMFSTQIVVVSQLEEKERVWLTALKRNISEQMYTDLIDKSDELTEEDEKELAEAVIEVVTRANKENIKKWKGANEMITETLREIMEPEINEAIEAGMEAKLITQISKKIQKGKDVNTIADELEEEVAVVERICAVAKDCGPDYDVETIYKKLKKMIACL